MKTATKKKAVRSTRKAAAPKTKAAVKTTTATRSKAAAPEGKAKSPKQAVTKKAEKKAVKEDLARSYNNFKEFEGQQYTGMKVGRGHRWKYDAGDWTETKITPDLWEISYAVTKRRKGHAPEGSGVPIGTQYHWYIIAHQSATKLNEDDYTTTMSGLKFKLAHKRADKDKWNLSGKTQRKHLAEFFKEMVRQLEKEPLPIEFIYKNQTYKGDALPIGQTCHDGICEELDVTLNDASLGIIRRMKNSWKIEGMQDKKFVAAIGEAITNAYQHA